MDLAGYVALTRQSGLAKELQTVANNIANLSTTGYRREGVVFAEMVEALPVEGGSVAGEGAGDGTIVNIDGHALLDEGGGAIAIPFEARHVNVSADGTISADGAPVARVGLVTVEDRTKLFREAGVLFRADAAPTPVEGGRVLQGFLEQSNVNPVAELARMVEVQRAYEYGQKLMDTEDERIRLVVRTLGQQG